MRLTRQETADLFARAVIASAWLYGDDPVVAMIGSEKLGNTSRRSLHAAGEAVRQKLNWPRATVAKCLNLQPASFKTAAMRREGKFSAALSAARGSIDRFIADLPPLGYPPLIPVEEPSPPAAPEIEAIEAGSHSPPVLVSPPPAVAPKKVVVRTDPPPADRTGKPVVTNRPAPAPHREGSLGDRIYAEVLKRPLSANSLATILDVKELHVINSLRALALEGAIISVTGGNESSQKWHAA